MPNRDDRSWLDALSDTPLNLGNYPGYAFKAAQFGGNALKNISASMSPVRFQEGEDAGFYPQVPPMITETAGAWDRLFGEQDNWYDGPGEIYPGDQNADAATAALTFYGGNAINPLAVKPRGSIASGVAREGADQLPMDHASRIARAKEMGFDTDRVWHNGSASRPEAFEIEQGNKYHPNAARVGAAWFSPSEKRARWYAERQSAIVRDRARAEIDKQNADKWFFEKASEYPPSNPGYVGDYFINPGRQHIAEKVRKKDKQKLHFG